MRCEEALEWIQRELDGDLTSEEQALLRRHLSTCIECADEAERFKRLSDGLSRLPRVTPPYSVVNHLIESEQLPKGGGSRRRGGIQRRRFRWWLSGGVAAVVLLIGSFGLWAWFQSDAPSPPANPSLMMKSETEEDAAFPSENRTMSAPENASPTFTVMSPDGRFRAEVEGNQVVVSTAEGKERFRSKPWKEGDVTSMRWLSPKSLRVEILQAKEGKTVQEVRIIDVEAKREQEENRSRGDGG